MTRIGSRNSRIETVVFLGALFFGLYFLFLYLLVIEQHDLVGDFHVFHAAAHAFVTGALQPSEIYNIDKLYQHMLTIYPGQSVLRLPWLYPPPMLFVVAPLGFFSFQAAYALWGGFLIVCMAGSAWLLGARGITLLALAINPSTVLVCWAGQSDPVLVLLLSIGVTQMGIRPLLSGTAVGAMFLKPQVAMTGALALLANRKFRECLYLLAVGSAAVAFFVVTLGLGAWSAFLEAGSGFFDSIRADTIPFRGLGSVYGALRSFSIADEPALILHVILAIMALVAAARLLMRGNRKTRVAAAILFVLAAVPYSTWPAVLMLIVPCCLFLDENHPAGLLLLLAYCFYPLLLVILLAPLEITVTGFLYLALLMMLLLKPRKDTAPGAA